MPLVSRGFYIGDREEHPCEVEATYQLKYYVSLILASIDHTLDPIKEMIWKFENKAQYYRHYVDGPFYFLGLINDRFFCKSNNRDADSQEKEEERAELNRSNYQFTEQNFCILNNRVPRNIIEYPNERNVKTMIESRGAGGFNVTFGDTASETVITITSYRELCPYNLDLINREMLFYNIQAKADDVHESDIDVLRLQNELRELQKCVDSLANFVNGC